MSTERIIIMGGGGNSKESYSLDYQYLTRFGIKSILYIPIALDCDDIGYEKCYEWIVGWVTKLSPRFINIDMCTDLSEIIDLLQYDSIYIGGGNTYKLLYQIKKYKWDTKLTDFYRQGGIIYGGSAGAIILGKSILTVPSEYLSLINQYNTDGLNLVEQLVRCHYNRDRDNRHLNKYLIDLSAKLSTPLLLIEEDSGAIFINEVREKLT